MYPNPDENDKPIPTMVFMHENAGNIGMRLDYFKFLIQTFNVNVLAMAYRGFSDSDGSPTEEGLKLDADAILSFLEKPKDYHQEIAQKIHEDLIFAHGRSLGGAVAIHMASQKPSLFRGLVVENSFTSISDMADVLFPILKYIKWAKMMILRIGWDSDKTVPNLKLPIFYVTGDQDEIVPHEQTLKLYELSKMAVFKELYIVPGGTHNDTWYVGGMSYVDNMKNFMTKCIHEYKRPTAEQVDQERNPNGGE